MSARVHPGTVRGRPRPDDRRRPTCAAWVEPLCAIGSSPPRLPHHRHAGGPRGRRVRRGRDAGGSAWSTSPSRRSRSTAGGSARPASPSIDAGGHVPSTPSAGAACRHADRPASPARWSTSAPPPGATSTGSTCTARSCCSTGRDAVSPSTSCSSSAGAACSRRRQLPAGRRLVPDPGRPRRLRRPLADRRAADGADQQGGRGRLREAAAPTGAAPDGARDRWTSTVTLDADLTPRRPRPQRRRLPARRPARPGRRRRAPRRAGSAAPSTTPAGSPPCSRSPAAMADRRATGPGTRSASPPGRPRSTASPAATSTGASAPGGRCRRPTPSGRSDAAVPPVPGGVGAPGRCAR